MHYTAAILAVVEAGEVAELVDDLFEESVELVESWREQARQADDCPRPAEGGLAENERTAGGEEVVGGNAHDPARGVGRLAAGSFDQCVDQMVRGDAIPGVGLEPGGMKGASDARGYTESLLQSPAQLEQERIRDSIPDCHQFDWRDHHYSWIP